jgi:hypothetical protein
MYFVFSVAFIFGILHAALCSLQMSEKLQKGNLLREDTKQLFYTYLTGI